MMMKKFLFIFSYIENERWTFLSKCKVLHVACDEKTAATKTYQKETASHIMWNTHSTAVVTAVMF